jgi:hypothetical protein
MMRSTRAGSSYAYSKEKIRDGGSGSDRFIKNDSGIDNW